jgi:sec-independent protein translocase protein TatA
VSVIRPAARAVIADATLDRSEISMGLDNPLHIAFLLVILLLVFGAKRLPEMGRSLGSGLRGFKEAISGDASSAPVEQLERAPASESQSR